jgi:hypothetical protein
MTKIRLKSASRKSGISRSKVRSVMAGIFSKARTKKAAKKKAAPKKTYRKAA